MSRLMSVALTEDAVRARRKTVTRRLGWRVLRPGDRLTLCRKVMGRRHGEPLVRIAEVEIVSVRRERLDAVTDAEVTREGFPDRTAEWFVGFFTEHMRCEPDTEVTRIEWRYLGEPTTEPAGAGAPVPADSPNTKGHAVTDPTPDVVQVIAGGGAAAGSPETFRAAQLRLAEQAGISADTAAALIPEGGIGAHAAAHVLAHYGEGGYQPGDFTRYLIETITRADPSNMYRLGVLYPGYVAAVRLARDTLWGVGFLRAVATGSE